MYSRITTVTSVCTLMTYCPNGSITQNLPALSVLDDASCFRDGEESTRISRDEAYG